MRYRGRHHESEAAALFAKLTELSRKEPGCLMYQVHRHKEDARRFDSPSLSAEMTALPNAPCSAA